MVILLYDDLEVDCFDVFKTLTCWVDSQDVTLKTVRAVYLFSGTAGSLEEKCHSNHTSSLTFVFLSLVGVNISRWLWWILKTNKPTNLKCVFVL